MSENYKVSKSNNPIVKLIDTQTTVWESGTWPESQYQPYNPDDLFQKYGDYTAYDEMMKDDQISVCMNIKKDLILGSGYHIRCMDDNDEEIRLALESSLTEDYEGSFEDSLAEIISAYDYGFSITERQFKFTDDGYLTLKRLKTRHPDTWLLHQDKYGNVVRYEQQGSTDEFSDIDKNSIIHFINNPRFGNPYGTSDLRSAYTAYFAKRQIIRFYAIFLEKAASPTPIAKYDRAAKQQDIMDIHNTIKKFQASTAMTVPKEFEIDFLESSGNGEAYLNGINLFNMFIGRALFVPDLLGFQGGPTTGGSQALGREQMVVFFKHIMKRRRTLENVVNEFIIKPIITYNYGFLENYPVFKLNPIEEKVAEENARLWLEAVKSRVYRVTDEEINHFKKIIDFPEGTPEEDEEIVDEQPADVIDDTAQSAEFPEQFAKKPYSLPPGDYHKKVDFKAIESHMVTTENQIMDKLNPVIDDIMKAYETQLKAKKINDPAKLTKLDSITIPTSLSNKFNKILNKELGMAFSDATARANAEISKGKQTYALDAPEFLTALAAENFNFVKDWEYELSKAARIAALQAVKDGKPISSVIKFVGEEIDRKARVSAERYSRTKTTEVLNKGRQTFFDNSDVVTAYQYSAILDDRTSDICSGLDGKIFEKGSQPIPPMHFNCRSVLVPITKYEEYRPSEKVGSKDIETFIEENKGRGFPKQ